ncbi:MAG: cob(I)yrinic acid a,c-diamide adenosyltransferase [Thalassobaculaceae bacterium]
MVKLDKIYTRGGDRGQTSLSDGQRVAKDSTRPAAFGDVDELNSVIGMVRGHIGDRPDVDAMLSRIQNDLFDLGADLATPEAEKPKYPPLRIIAAQVDRLEREIDDMNAGLAPLTSFILPGGTSAAAATHLARTVARRAERRIVTLGENAAINPQALAYINRLSDHLFVLARYLNGKGSDDILWRPGANR